MNRSDFIKSGGMLVACTCGISLLNGCKSITGNSDTPVLSENNFRLRHGTLILDLAHISELKEIGGAVKLELPDRKLKIIVARSRNREFIALRDRCSHGGRELEYFDDQSIFQCVSFGHSRFDKEGNVVKGPAKNMLLKYNTALIDDELQIIIGLE